MMSLEPFAGHIEVTAESRSLASPAGGAVQDAAPSVATRRLSLAITEFMDGAKVSVLCGLTCFIQQRYKADVTGLNLIEGLLASHL